LPLKTVKAKRNFERLLSDASLRGSVERVAHLPHNASAATLSFFSSYLPIRASKSTCAAARTSSVYDYSG
jgi:hypothetical protein